MAWCEVNCYSKALGMDIKVNVILPHMGADRPDLGKRKTLVLLHGAFGNQDDWLRRTTVELMATCLGLAVILPGGHMSAYMNMEHGGAFYTFVAGELLPQMRRIFPLSDQREDTFIAGLSMGGFGAMLVGLSNPQVFSHIGCLSAGMDLMRGVLDERLLPKDTEKYPYLNGRAFAVQTAQGKNPPQHVYLACGRQDSLYRYALETKAFFESVQSPTLRFTYQEADGGHTWAFWETYIAAFLQTLSLPAAEGAR